MVDSPDCVFSKWQNNKNKNKKTPAPGSMGVCVGSFTPNTKPNARIGRQAKRETKIQRKEETKSKRAKEQKRTKAKEQKSERANNKNECVSLCVICQ